MKWSEPAFYGKYEVRKYQNLLWLKVFYQNIADLIGFANKSEALNCNLKTKYSILGEIDETFRLKNGKFELILEIPEKDKFNRWMQTNFPVNETEKNGKYKVDGYFPKHIGIPHDQWGGLALSTGTAESFALLNGTPGYEGAGSWGFAVGQYTGAYWTFNGTLNYKIPFLEPVDIVYLWLRIPNKLHATCNLPSQSRKGALLLSYSIILLSWQ